MDTVIFLSIFFLAGPACGTLICRAVMANRPKTRGDWLALIVSNLAAWPAVVSFGLAGLLFMGIEQVKPYLRPMRVGIF